MKAAALRCQLLLILLMSAVMLLPGTNGSLLLVQRTVTRTIVLQETISKVFNSPTLSKVQNANSILKHKEIVRQLLEKCCKEQQYTCPNEAIAWDLFIMNFRGKGKVEYSESRRSGVFSPCCLALDSSSSFPCPAFRAIAKSVSFICRLTHKGGDCVTGGGSCCSEMPAASHRVDGSNAVTGDERFTAACSEKNCQDHQVTRKDRQ
ncbi:hypothetical protein STEG23_016609, partial [Scotinomys teguina]